MQNLYIRDSVDPIKISWILGVLVLVAFILRILAIALYDDRIWGYHYLAKNILEGNGFRDWGGGPHLVFPPFSAYFYATISKITGLSILASSRLGNCIVSSLVILPVYGLTRRTCGNIVSITLALAIALFPYLIILGSQAHSDVLLSTFVLTGGWLVMLILEKDTQFAFPMLGFVMGIAYLTKPDGMMYYVLFLLVIFISKYKYLSRKLFYNLILSLFCYSLLALPYIYYLSVNSGKLLFTGKVPYVIAAANAVYSGNWMEEYYALNGNNTERIVDDYKKYTLIEYIYKNPEKMKVVYFSGLAKLKKFIYEPIERFFGVLCILLASALLYKERQDLSVKNMLKLLFMFSLFYGIFFLIKFKNINYNSIFLLNIAVAFLFVIILTREHIGKSLLFISFFVPLLFIPVSMIVPRYAYAYIIFAVLILIAGIYYLYCCIFDILFVGLAKHKNIILLKFVIISLVFSVGVFDKADASYFKKLISFRDYKIKYSNVSKEASFEAEVGKWIVNNLPKNSRVMARNLKYTYFAVVDTVQLPYGSYSDVLVYARNKNVEYFLFSKHEFKDAIAFRSLWNEDYNPNDFELVKMFTRLNDKVFIYRLIY